MGVRCGLAMSTGLDEPFRTRLANGLTLLQQQTRSPLVSVQYWVKTGSIHESDFPGSGVSHFLEHMLFKGTDRRDARELATAIHALGGAANAYTTHDRTVYYIDGPEEAFRDILELLTDMVFRSVLPNSEFLTERDVILREIDMDFDDPDRQLFHRFTEAAFRVHPYRFPVIGLPEAFRALTRDDLLSYYRARYAASNAVLVVTGAPDSATVLAVAEELAGGLGGLPVKPVAVAGEPLQTGMRTANYEMDVNLTRSIRGYRIPGVFEDVGPALKALAAMLGRGNSSWLTKELRDELKLVHHIDASCWNPGEAGQLLIGYICAPEKADRVPEAIDCVLRRFAEKGPASDELSKVVRQAEVAQLNGRKTCSGLAGHLGISEVLAGDPNWAEHELSRLRSLCADDIVEACRRWIQPAGETRVSMRPRGSVVQTRQDRTCMPCPDFELRTLSNGVRLLVQPWGEVPKSTIRLIAAGGALFEPQHQRGITGILATLLTRDTEVRSAADVAAFAENRGGHFSETVGNNSFGLNLEFLSVDQPAMLELFHDSLCRIAPREKTLQTEIEIQVAGILEELDDPVEFGRRELRKVFFGEHPYALDVLGREEDLRGLTIADLEAFRMDRLTGCSAIAVLSGELSDATVAACEETLLHLPPGEPRLDLPVAGAPEATLKVVYAEREQAILFSAFPMPGALSPQMPVFDLLEELFSGLSSNLFHRVREEKGLAYFVAAQRLIGLENGVFYLFAGTRPDAVADVEIEFEAELERVRQGRFLPGELEACKRRLAVRKRSRRQSMGGRTMEVALDVFYNHGPSAYKAYDERVAGLDAEEVASVAARCFDPNHNVRLHVLPGDGN